MHKKLIKLLQLVCDFLDIVNKNWQTFPKCRIIIIYRLLNIPSSMPLRRLNSQADHQRLFKMKDMHFFRTLLKHYDLALVKDYFQSSLKIAHAMPSTLYSFDHSKFVYVSAEQCRVRCTGINEIVVLQEGHRVQESIEEIQVETPVQIYYLSCKTIMILQRLNFLPLPFIENLKSSKRFQYLEKCEVLNLNFNSFAYRKGEDVDAIYYIIQGQVRIIKDIDEKIYQIISLEKGKNFGLFQLKNNFKRRELCARAGLNNTQILKIPIKILHEISAQRQQNFEHFINQLKSQLYMNAKISDCLNKKEYILKESLRTKTVNSSTASGMNGKLATFQSKMVMGNRVIQNLMHSKYLIFKINELNGRNLTRHKSCERLVQIQNINQIKHLNDKWRCTKEKPRLTNSINRSNTLKSNNTNLSHRLSYSNVKMKLGFQGLTKYPAVKRYLNCTESSDCKDSYILNKYCESSRSQLIQSYQR